MRRPTARSGKEAPALANDGDGNEERFHARRKNRCWAIGRVLCPFGFSIVGLAAGVSAAESPHFQSAAARVDGESLGKSDENEEPKPEEASPHDSAFEDDPAPVLNEEELGSPGPFQGPSNDGEIGSSWEGAFASRRIHRNYVRYGGGREFESAVEHALLWLAAHQSKRGNWEAAEFMNWCHRKPAEADQKSDGPGKATYDVGVTGLALCAFLAAGYNNRSDHPFAANISAGLRYLKNMQDPEGCFGPRSAQQYVYNHAVASLAMIEAYGVANATAFQGPAQRALDFIALTRNPYLAWRYGIKPGENDTSVTGWMMMALKSADLINADAAKRNQPMALTTDEAAWSGIKDWIDKVTDAETGRVGYQSRGTGPARLPEMTEAFPNSKSEAMTAVGMLARLFGGEPPSSEIVKKGAALCAQLPPTWNEPAGTIDMYYWYYATLAMYQVGGSHWDGWHAAMKGAIVDTQRRDTDYCRFKGSWDPKDPWSTYGGRVYTTAMQALNLTVFYRYDKMFRDGE